MQREKETEQVKKVKSSEMEVSAQGYSYEQAVEASKKYFKGDDLAATVWVSKYALKDSYGKIYELDPSDLHRRLAREFRRIEARYPNPMTEEEIFETLDQFK